MRQSGELITMPWDSDRAKREKTVQCVHCGRHHVIRQAFRRAVLGRLGFCARCNGITCGEKCGKCVPMEKWLDAVEKGISPEEMPTRVSFSDAQ